MFGRATRNRVIESASRRVPFLKKLPVIRLIAIAELAIVAKRHLEQLTPAERRRLARLIRRGRDLSPKEREDLRRLVGKLEPRAFAGSAAERFSPFPLPRRLTGARY